MKKLWWAVLLLPVLVWAGESPFNGTWKIDLSKVQFPDKPDTWVLQAGRYQCSTCEPRVDVKADGTDQPTAGAKYRDTSAVKLIDDKTVEFTDKKGGKVVGTERWTVSADGKTLGVEFTGYPEASQEPVKGKSTLARVAAGPMGSHAISGSWRAEKVDTVTSNALTYTYKMSADGLLFSAATGETYDAKFDGKDYPIKGDRAGAVVSVRKIDERSLDETTKIGGKVVYVNHITVSPDGKSMTLKWEDKQRGTTTTWVAARQ